MSVKDVFDVITVGHLAIDTIITPKVKEATVVLGGPPTYVSVAAAKLGARVSIISKVGSDFPNESLDWLNRNQVDLTGLRLVPKASSTRFVLDYTGKERMLKLITRAPPISLGDVRSSARANAIHVAPIANEVSPRVVNKLRKLTKILSFDPQGFVRRFDDHGNVVFKEWRDPDVLARIDIFKSSAEEIQVIARTKDLRSAMKKMVDYEIKVVLITRGLRGSILFFEDDFYYLPIYRPKKVIDPTGAGDAYIGGFLSEYLRCKDALWSASVGAAAASFVVEAIGPGRFGEMHEVYERAQTIYGKSQRNLNKKC
jgi:sugar/nucleoside kinase (ribokinase family)